MLLQNFVPMVKTQFSRDVKIIQSDNGFEFLSTYEVILCHKGILHQTSCMYTPQQNGRVECKRRHILNVARPFRFHAHLHLQFWGEFALTVAYLLNQTPSTILNGKPRMRSYLTPSPHMTILRNSGVFDTCIQSPRINLLLGVTNGFWCISLW